MKLIYPFLKLKRKWNVFIKKQLRKVGIFPRLIISFMLLLLFTSLFLTFFTFYQYSTELTGISTAIPPFLSRMFLLKLRTK